MRNEVRFELQKLATRLILEIDMGQRIGKAIFLSYSTPGEGNTTLLAELGREMGKYSRFSTLLVDGNLRSPKLHEFWGIPQRPGLTEISLHELAADSVVQKTEYQNVFLLPAGSPVDHPDEFFTSPQFNKTLEELRQNFHLLLFDSPPLLKYNDALAMGKALDGTLLLTRSEFTPSSLVRRGHHLMKEQGIKVLGGILNRKRDYIPRIVRNLLHSPDEG